MKECPNCNEKTIPLKWVFFDKGLNLNGYCIKCENCNANIRKKKWLILDILFPGLWLEGTFIFIITLLLANIFHSLLYAFVSTLLIWTTQHLLVEYFASLKVSDEAYCRGDMSKIGAFFALIFMAFLIGMLIYCFIIQPFILGERFCS